MSKSRTQLAIQLLGAGLAGFLLLGSFLDAVSNAISLITPAVAIVGTILLPILLLCAEYALRRWGLRWQFLGGDPVRIAGLGSKLRWTLFGMVVLLWVPQVIGLWHGPNTLNETTARKLTGSLQAALAASRASASGLQVRISMAPLLMRDCPNASVEHCSYFGLSPLNLPQVLPALLIDGDLYGAMSPSLRRKLPEFINTLKNLEAAFEPKSNKPFNLGVLKMLHAELRTEIACLELEIEYVSGRLAPDEHQKRFNEALQAQAAELLSGNRQ